MLLLRYVPHHGDGLKLELTPFLIQFKLPKTLIASVICDVLEGDDRVTEAVACYKQVKREVAWDKDFRDERVEWELGG